VVRCFQPGPAGLPPAIGMYARSPAARSLEETCMGMLPSKVSIWKKVVVQCSVDVYRCWQHCQRHICPMPAVRPQAGARPSCRSAGNVLKCQYLLRAAA